MRKLFQWLKNLFTALGSTTDDQAPELDATNPLVNKLNINRLKEKLKLIELGESQGEKNLPKSTDLRYDGNEHQIVYEIKNRVSTVVSDFNARASEHSRQIQSHNIDPDVSTLRALPENFRIGFRNWKIQNVPDNLNVLRDTFRATKTQLKRFRERHKLERPPKMVDSATLWTFIGICLVGQVIVNAFFFSNANPDGLAGGLMFAVFFALFDVCVAYIFGNGIRQNNGSERWQTLVGRLSVLFAGVWCLGFNLFVAHYRLAMLEIRSAIRAASAQQESVFFGKEEIPFDQLLEQTDTIAMSIAGASFFKTTFDLQNLPTALLFGFGLLLSVGVVVSGYRADDPFPGYGHLGREKLDAKEELDSANAPIREQLYSEYRINKGRLEKERRNIDQTLDEVEFHIRTKSDFLMNVRGFYQDRERAINTLLQLYRGANERTRTDPAPAHFQEEGYILEKPDWLDDDMSRDHQHLKEQRMFVESTRKTCIDVDELLSKHFRDFLDELDADAAADEEEREEEL